MADGYTFANAKVDGNIVECMWKSEELQTYTSPRLITLRHVKNTEHTRTTSIIAMILYEVSQALNEPLFAKGNTYEVSRHRLIA